jgi:Glycerol-3-phosphate dehydrogenase
MKKFLIIGGGAMGSAFTIHCLENKNDVVITEPYSKKS